MTETKLQPKLGMTLHLPVSTLERIDREARKNKSSRSRYIQDMILGVQVTDGRKEIIQSRIVATNVYFKLDLAELQPVFDDLSIIASSMQELVLRPDRTTEEKAESRILQKQLLSEIRKIRIRMEEWGDTRIGNAQASFAEGEGLRERSGLSDVSVG